MRGIHRSSPHKRPVFPKACQYHGRDRKRLWTLKWVQIPINATISRTPILFTVVRFLSTLYRKIGGRCLEFSALKLDRRLSINAAFYQHSRLCKFLWKYILSDIEIDPEISELYLTFLSLILLVGECIAYIYYPMFPHILDGHKPWIRLSKGPDSAIIEHNR